MKKKNLFLSLALAGVFALSLTSCGSGNNAVMTSGGAPAVTTTSNGGEGDPVKQVEYKYFASTSLNSPIIFGVEKIDNKLNGITVFGGEIMGVITPDYKDNKIVGLKFDSIQGGERNNYIAVGDDFSNNIGNYVTVKTANNNLVFSFNNVSLSIGNDGNATATGMQEINPNMDIKLDRYSIKTTANSVELSTSGQKVVISRTDSGASMEVIDEASGDTQYKITKERVGNFGFYTMAYSSSGAPVSIVSIKRLTYDSNNRVIQEGEYYTYGSGYYGYSPYHYYYNDKGQLVSVEGSYDTDEYEYDSYGRLNKEVRNSSTKEYTYLDNGLYASTSTIYTYQFYGTSEKIVYEYDSNNRVSKETYYDYDFDQESFNTTASATKTYVYNNTGTVATTVFADGSKKVETSSATENKTLSTTETFDSSNNLTDFTGQEGQYTNGIATKQIKYGFANGKKYITAEVIRTSGENTQTTTYYSYSPDGSIESQSYKVVDALENGRILSSHTYNYDTTAQDFATVASGYTLITRDSDDKVTKIDNFDSNLNEVVTEFTYSNGELSTAITTYNNYDSETKTYSLDSKDETRYSPRYSHGFIVEYNEYNSKNLMTEHLVYNSACDLMFEDYYNYDEQGNRTADSYSYVYSYNDYGFILSKRMFVYNTTTKELDKKEMDRSFSYDGNNNLIKETYEDYTDDVQRTLENTFNSNGKIETQILTEIKGGTLSKKLKYVQDYTNKKTKTYSFVSGNWEEQDTYNYITYLECYNSYK